MTEKVTRRRRRRVLVPLLGVGVAAWFVKRRLDAGQRLDEGWHELPPSPWAVPTETPVPSPAPEPVGVAVGPTPATPTAPNPTAPKPAAPTPTAPKPAPPVAMPPAAPAALFEPPAEPRAVAAAATAASVTAPVAPSEAPFGPGSVRALADGTSPDPDFAVKGKTATKVFHAPGGAYYTRTRADVWFRTPADAQAAGFTERGPRRHR